MSVLIVTGASRGIGAEIGRLAAQRGWAVCINYATSEEEAEAVAEQIISDGGNAITAQADVTVESQVEAMFNKVDRELGPVTGLVNNAAANGLSVRVDDIDPDTTRHLFDVNIIGPFICAKHAIRRMAKRHGGSGGAIVNISSAAAGQGGPFAYVDYAASKAALDTFTVGLAKEQAMEGIRVNALRPGTTMTGLSIEWAKENPEWLQTVVDQVPLQRPAEVPEIAKAALFLLSDEASYVTGAILDASGGWVSP